MLYFNLIDHLNEAKFNTEWTFVYTNKTCHIYLNHQTLNLALYTPSGRGPPLAISWLKSHLNTKNILLFIPPIMFWMVLKLISLYIYVIISVIEKISKLWKFRHSHFLYIWNSPFNYFINYFDIKFEEKKLFNIHFYSKAIFTFEVKQSIK